MSVRRRSVIRFALVATLAVSALWLAACSSSAPSTATVTTAATATVAPSPAQPTATAQPSATVPAATATATASPQPTKTATSAPSNTGQHGTLTVAVPTIPPAGFLPSNQKYPDVLNYMSWGITSPLMYQEALAPSFKTPVTKALVSSWTMSSDQQSLTFHLRQGVKFTGNWGDLTAADVVYTFDQSFATGSVARVQQEGFWMGKWQQTGPYTVVLHATQGAVIPPDWARRLSNNWTWGGIWSKAVYDKLGPSGANTTAVGTGPFDVEKWTDSQEVKLKAKPSQYRETAKVASVDIRAIPDEATRLSAFRAGEIDISPVSIRFMNGVMKDTGATATQITTLNRQILWFAGNFWAKTDIVTGKPVPQRPAFKPDAQHPWIGNPDDPTQMQKSADVRWAISYAIDRQALNKAILDGYGSLGPQTFYGFAPGDPLYQSKWGDVYKFDPQKAKQLLTEAGYPNGFSVDFYIPPDAPGVSDPQLDQAVAQMLQDNLGLDVHIDSTAYAGKRPALVDRQFAGLWIPYDQLFPPAEPQDGFQTPAPGWNPGVEIPAAQEAWWKGLHTSSEQARLQLNANVQEDLYNLRWNTIVLTKPTFDLVAKNVKWHPTSLNGAAAGDFEKALITG